MGAEDDNQNSILKGILQNGSSFNYPGGWKKISSNKAYRWQIKCDKSDNFWNLISISAVRFGRVPKREKAKINAAMHSSRMKNMETRVMAEMADDAKIIETVVRAHFDTCDYTAEKIKPFIAKAQAEQNYTLCSGMVSNTTVYMSVKSQNLGKGFKKMDSSQFCVIIFLYI